MADTEIKLGFDETPLPASETPQRIETTWGNIRVVSAVPTWVPQGKQEDSMALYVSGTTQRLYFYDFTNNQWRYFTHTTVAASGSTALEGDVVIAGSGLDVSQASQTVTIAPKVPYFDSANGSLSFNGSTNWSDATFAVGFDPKLILFWGWISDAAITSPSSQNYVNTNTVPRPSIWTNGTYNIGPAINSAGAISGNASAGKFMSKVSTFSNNVELLIQSHDSTNTVIRFNRVSGAVDEQLYYQYYFLAFA
jgi:hypothetical protein